MRVVILSIVVFVAGCLGRNYNNNGIVSVDETSKLDRVVGMLEVITAGQSGTRTADTAAIKVAFFANNARDIVYGAGQTIVFENVITNVGNGYNAMLGTFTTPIAGTYVIYTTISAKTGKTLGIYYAGIMVNGVQRAQLLTKPFEQSTQTVIMQLEKENVVQIKNIVAGNEIISADSSNFGGFLLHV